MHTYTVRAVIAFNQLIFIFSVNLSLFITDFFRANQLCIYLSTSYCAIYAHTFLRGKTLATFPYSYYNRVLTTLFVQHIYACMLSLFGVMKWPLDALWVSIITIASYSFVFSPLSLLNLPATEPYRCLCLLCILFACSFVENCFSLTKIVRFFISYNYLVF